MKNPIKEYLKVREEIEPKMESLQSDIDGAFFDAELFDDFSGLNLREAKADDIEVGAIIYYHGDGKHQDPFWQIVLEPLYYGDLFKAYEAEDGCRYGLDGAYVEEEGK